MIETILNKIPFKKTLVAGLSLFALGCGDTIIHNHYNSDDNKQEEEDATNALPEEDVIEEDAQILEPSQDIISPIDSKQDIEYNLDNLDLIEEVSSDVGNQCPVFDPKPQDIIVDEKSEMELNFNAIDPDGDTLTFKLFASSDKEPGDWEDLSEVDEFDVKTGKLEKMKIKCHNEGEYTFKIIASDGKCETKEEFKLIVNDTCDCDTDGQVLKTSCETTTPCQGYQQKVCVDGFWETLGNCEDNELIGHGLIPSVSDGKVAFLNDNNVPFTLDVYDKITKETKTVYTFESGEEPLMSLKLDGDRLMFTRYNTDTDKGKATVVDINTDQILFNLLVDGELNCTDIENQKVICAVKEEGTNGTITLFDLYGDAIDLMEFGSPYDLDVNNDELHNLVMDQQTLVFPMTNKSYDLNLFDVNSLQFFQGPNLEGLIETQENFAPLISNGKILFVSKKAQGLNSNKTFLYDLEEDTMQDITEESTGFSCKTTYRYFADFENKTAVCHVKAYGSDQLYVINFETKEYQKISNTIESYAMGYVSLDNNNLVFTIDEDLGDNVPIYLCELKPEWGEFETDVVEEEVAEEVVEE